MIKTRIVSSLLIFAVLTSLWPFGIVGAAEPPPPTPQPQTWNVRFVKIDDEPYKQIALTLPSGATLEFDLTKIQQKVDAAGTTFPDVDIYQLKPRDKKYFKIPFITLSLSQHFTILVNHNIKTTPPQTKTIAKIIYGNDWGWWELNPKAIEAEGGYETVAKEFSLFVAAAQSGTLTVQASDIVDIDIDKWFDGTKQDGVTLNIVDPPSSGTADVDKDPPPTIHLDGFARTGRETLDFRLRRVTTYNPSGDYDVFVYFCVYKKASRATTDYKNVCIRINMEGTVWLVKDAGIIESPSDDTFFTHKVWGPISSNLTTDEQSNTFLHKIVNRIYNGRNAVDRTDRCGVVTEYPSQTANPAYNSVHKINWVGGITTTATDGQYANCVNQSPGGWIAHWTAWCVKHAPDWDLGANTTTPNSTTGVEDLTKHNTTCECPPGWSFDFGRMIKCSICLALYTIVDALKGAIDPLLTLVTETQ